MWSDFRAVTESIEKSPRRGKVDGQAEKNQFFWMGCFQIVGVPSFLASSPAIAAGKGLASSSEDCGFLQ